MAKNTHQDTVPSTSLFCEPCAAQLRRIHDRSFLLFSVASEFSQVDEYACPKDFAEVTRV